MNSMDWCTVYYNEQNGLLNKGRLALFLTLGKSQQ